jgi:3-methyl-2-oxobutanoate hydroxymethyltransferase
MARMEIPVIGIGAGPSTDGQVLVFHDLLGIYDGHKPKFAKRYANLREEMVKGVEAYAEEVRTRRFPGPEHAYGVAPEELERLREMLPPAPVKTV